MKEYIKKVAVTLLVIIAFIVIPLVLYHILPYFTPFILAFLFALLIEPFNQWLMKHIRLKRPFAMNITFFLLMGVFVLLAYFLTTKIIREAFELIKYIQRNIPQIQDWFNEFFQRINDFIVLLPAELAAQINQTIYGFINQLSNANLVSSVGVLTFNLTAAIPNFFFVLLIFFIALYMISFDLPRVTRRFYSFFKDDSKVKLEAVLSDLRMATIGFVKAQIILSTVTYLVSFCGLAILGVRYALAIAFLIILVDILPILGTGSVLVPWGIFMITQGNFYRGFGLIILFIIITVLRKIIEPKILGERIGLGPLSTLISIWIGFKVLGVLGVMLAPLLIILYKALVKARVIRFRLRI
jgi:sporulation integral membrane protein YtvI